MVDVIFELTTNDPWSVDDAICEGISPLGYLQKVNQSPTLTKPYNRKTNVGTSIASVPVYEYIRIWYISIIYVSG